ncbi:MAG: PRC-barrel domain-containing protein, partial [Clostridiales bacterium]|nr:PRC-barrel domain-containing protein [Clostridiales bacterium]
ESLRCKFLTIDRVNAVDLDEGEFFIADLIGCTLFTEKGDALGKVTDVLQHGAVDVLCAVDSENKEFRFPFLKRLLLGADMQAKTIMLDGEKLQEVCVYDD